MKGVDISNWKAGFDVTTLPLHGFEFVIVKLSQGTTYIDPSGAEFYAAAVAAGIPVGGFVYSVALNEAQARAEAAFAVKLLRGYPMPLGIFLDIEEPEQLALPPAHLMAIARAFCAEIRAAGYTPGIYSSELSAWSKIDPNALNDDVLVWIARYGRSPDLPCDLWQSSERGRVPGYSGFVDIDEVRSDRFRAMVEATYKGHPDPKGEPGEPGPVEAPAPEKDLTVMQLQTIMAYDGYWDIEEITGIKTPEFRTRFVEYAEAVAGC